MQAEVGSMLKLPLVRFANKSVAGKRSQRQHCVNRCLWQQLQEACPPLHQHNEGQAAEESSTGQRAGVS